METKRKWYPTKAAWAEAQAKDYREAALRTFVSSYGRRSRAQARSAGMDYNRQRALHFEALAERFRAEGD